ncbi:MAG: ROK family protein [Candidatus Eremiobacteraeota bacterium]|nr:ROK family protein [Candidatus Eremiobacteraeota bacterium]
MMAAVVDEQGTILYRQETDISEHGFDFVVETIAKDVRAAAEAAGEPRLPPIGIGSPGNIDPTSGAVRYSPNFEWHDVPLGAEVEKRLGVPVLVGNDARCATLGEHAFGSGKGTTNFAMLTLGTGIGGGIVADGTLVLGNAFGAGEFGHHQIRATDGFVCGCGKTGCFEAQASGQGLLRHVWAVSPSFPRSALIEGKRSKLGSKAVRRAAEAGDPHALAAWARYIDDLARGLANVIAFVNPEVIALGGGVSSAGDFMLNAVRPKVEVLTTMVPRGTTRIVTAALGNDAGAIGAAVMARRGGLVARTATS